MQINKHLDPFECQHDPYHHHLYEFFSIKSRSIGAAEAAAAATAAAQ